MNILALIRAKFAGVIAKILTASALITSLSSAGFLAELGAGSLLPACNAHSPQDVYVPKLTTQSLKVGGVYYFACDGISLKKIKQAMSVKEGDFLHFTPGEMGSLRRRLVDAVHEATDDEPSDVAIIVTDETQTDAAKSHADKICYCYIGLRGKNLEDSTIEIGSVGARAPLKVPEKIQSKYLEIMQSEFRSSAGNAGTEKLKANLVREELLKDALKNADELLAVSRSSSDALHRRIANYCLGLIANNKDQLEALARATHDSDVTVRKNAISALMSIGQNESLQALVPAVQLIPLLNSPTWSERNQGSALISIYTKSRQAEFLEELRKQALPSLKEMAGWDADHARAALLILGRIGGINEDKLLALINKDERSEILACVSQNSAAKQVAKDQAELNKSVHAAQKLVSKLQDKPASAQKMLAARSITSRRADLPNGFYLVLRESPDNKHVRAAGKNEVILVNDYRFLAPEERDTAEYLVIDRTQFIPFEMKGLPDKQRDERGRPKLLVTLSESQIKPLEDFTSKYAGRQVVIVVGGEVVTKHKIREAIKGGLIQITRCTDNGCEAIYTELVKK